MAGMKRFGCFELDTRNECLWCEGRQIDLAPKLFAVLRYLVEHAQQLVTQDELLDAVWPETFVQPQVLRTYMLELRKLLGDDAANPRFIATLPKRGYRFMQPVTEVAERNGAAAAPGATKTVVAPPAAEAFGEAAGEAAMLGRAAELEQLEEHFRAVERGARRVVFITGETGIGKSALLDVFCQRVCQGSQAVVARGQSVEGFGGKEAYYPVMEALSQLCKSEEHAEAVKVISQLAPNWYAQLGSAKMDGAPAGLIATDAPRERLLGEICDALEALAASKPLVLAFEDLQWADACTLDAISALARRRSLARVMIVATCRRSDLREGNGHALKELKQNLAIRRLCHEIPLAPLGRADVSAYIERQLGGASAPAGLASFVHQHSEGNPLFMIAMVEHLLAQKVLLMENSAWRLKQPLAEIDLGVPDGLAEMIEMEINRLSAEQQRLLEAGSLLGVVFPAWAAAAAIDTDPVDAEELYDELAQQLHFLRPAGHDELPDGTRSAFYIFAHSMYREALFRRQSASKRSRRHLRIARKLEALFQGREAHIALELASHYEAAGDWVHAIEALEMAAERAHEREAPDEAKCHLERALALNDNLGAAQRDAIRQRLRGRMEEMEGVAEAVCAPSRKRAGMRPEV
jgi:DNA-binding winged helix-turn-helix (wHTH) protein